MSAVGSSCSHFLLQVKVEKSSASLRWIQVPGDLRLNLDQVGPDQTGSGQ